MTDEVLQEAKAIETEIEKLIEENNQILEYGMPKTDDKAIFRIRPLLLQRKKRRCKLALKKSQYGMYKEEILFELTPEDAEMLFNRRVKRVHELKRELKELK